MADALTQSTVDKALVVALKDHDGNKQYLGDSVASVVERIAAKYAANRHSAKISALRNESVAGEMVPRASSNGPIA